MDKNLSESLIDEFQKHFSIANIDRSLFLDTLISSDAPKPSELYKALPDNKQLIQESKAYHYLSLNGIINNANARKNHMPSWMKEIDCIASFLGISNYEGALMTHDGLVCMMEKSRQPYSLIGELKTYDYDNPEERLFIMTRPVLVIPSAKNKELIINWEEANTKYEKEIRIAYILPTTKKIKPEEYFST